MRFLELARLGYITFGASHKTHFNQYEDIVYQHRRVPNDEVSFYFTVLVGSHNLDSMKLAFSRVVSLDWEFPKQ